MRKQHLLVFDDRIPSTTQVFTADAVAYELGGCDKLAIHCVVDNQNAAGGILVQIQHSGDGIRWLNKYSGSGEISTPNNVPASGAANLGGFDQGATPSFAYVRL